MTDRKSWVCCRCNKVNAPHLDQCTCVSWIGTAGTVSPFEPYKPNTVPFIPYSPNSPYRWITPNPFDTRTINPNPSGTYPQGV